MIKSVVEDKITDIKYLKEFYDSHKETDNEGNPGELCNKLPLPCYSTCDAPPPNPCPDEDCPKIKISDQLSLTQPEDCIQ